MRTTLNLDDQLMKRAKLAALERDRTLSSLIDDALHLLLDQMEGAAAEELEAAPLPVARSGRLRPGVDLTNNAALYDLLDAEG